MIDEIISYFKKHDKEIIAAELFNEERDYYDYKEGTIRNPLNENTSYNPSKKTLLIIDDNEGIVSFLKDDINYLDKQGIINKDEINVVTLTGNYAAFDFEVLHDRYKGLNITWAIIDITLGGSVMTPTGNVKYNGVDVLEIIYKYNPNTKYIFYTGNNLNPYIKSNKQLLEKYKKLSNDSIEDHILFKTSFNMDERRKYLEEKLFKGTGGD